MPFGVCRVEDGRPARRRDCIRWAVALEEKPGEFSRYVRGGRVEFCGGLHLRDRFLDLSLPGELQALEVVLGSVIRA